MEQALTILVADDNPSDRLLLKAMLTQQGHKVITATDGQEAINLFDPQTIQLVCLDVKMPHKDGWEAALEIQRLAGDVFVPIIFLSGVTDPVAMTNCLQVGGTDFISKPYSPTLVTAKLNAIARLLVLQKTLEEQRDRLSHYNETLLHEQEVAKVVYENITHSNCLNDKALSTFHHGSHTFNGDVVLAAYKPNGGMHLLIGDFTGHGLSAAIGALPLADIFFDWTKKGFLMRQILPEINARLKRILPANMFCSAAFVDIKASDKSIEVWNGGLPDLLFFSQNDPLPKRISSKNLPLGILDPVEFACSIEPISFQTGDVLLAYSDGVYEATTRHGEMFCDSLLRHLYNGSVAPQDCLTWLTENLKHEGVLDNPHDDISCLEVRLSEQIGKHLETTNDASRVHESPADFSFEYTLNADSLRSIDPLPYVLQIITTVPGLGQHASQVFMILSELYSNALEHGVLRLSSDKKSTAEGFSTYYEDREKALTNLQSGWVKIKVKVISDAHQGELVLQVQDSGEGFNYEHLRLDVTNTDIPYNRGLALLSQLCNRLVFSDAGSTVTAHFFWSPSQEN